MNWKQGEREGSGEKGKGKTGRNGRMKKKEKRRREGNSSGRLHEEGSIGG